MPGQRAALTLLILIETAAFAYMSETVVFPALVAAAALIGFRRTKRYTLSQDRQVILALVAALVFVAKWRVQPYSLPEEPIFYLSPFLHALGQFLLLLQTAALYLAHDRDLLPVMLPWPGVFVMVSAGDVAVLPPQRFAFQLFSAGFVAATALYFSATARAAAGSDRRPHGVGKAILAGLLLVGTGALAWAASSALHRYENTLDRLVAEMLNAEPAASGAGFPSRSRLGSIVQRKSERANDVALRVYSNAEPGYLRGKAYHWLNSVRGARTATTQWEEAPDAADIASGSGSETLRPGDRTGARTAYELRPKAKRADAPAAELEVWLDSPQSVYFVPPLATEIVTGDGEVRRDYRQVSSGSDDPIVNYAVRTGPPPDSEPFFDLAAADGSFSRAALTHVPDSATGRDIVRQIADEIFADCVTIEDHVAAVENYFRSKYGYAIGIDVPFDQDPVIWFLQTRPKAHCEFFAQAAALLLRTRGVPTRYMTGFVAAERNEYGGYWLARNEHAHAWCEAWDDRRGWVIVEATPPAGVPSESAAPMHRQLWEYLSGAVTELRHRFAEGGWRWLLDRLAAFFLSPAGILVALAMVGYVVVRLRMRRPAAGRSLPPAVAEMHRLLARMDRRLAKAGLLRGRGETLARFAGRVEVEAADPQAAAWYADYAAARYGGSLDEATVDCLRTRLRTMSAPRRRSREPASTARHVG